MKGKLIGKLEEILNSAKKIGKKAVAVGVITAMLYSSVKASQGQLEIINALKDVSGSNFVYNVGHVNDASEGYVGGEDFDYDRTILSPNGYRTKLISRVDGHELGLDARPVDNNSVDLELSLHSENGQAISITSGNELRCSLPWASEGYDFGNKPITYWEKNETDPNYASLVANVRKEILQNSGVVPLEDLDGTYTSEEPYLYAGIRFDVYDSDLNEDGKVDFHDYAIYANNYYRNGITDANRIDVNDPGAWADFDLDGDVDMRDLACFNDLWEYSNETNRFEW